MITSELQSFQQEYARFSQQQGSDVPDWTKTLRQAAISQFLEQGLPTTRDEEWRFTNIAPLLRRPFQLPSDELTLDSVVSDLVEKAALADECARLVFVNGRYSQRWSHSSLVDQQMVGSLATSMRDTKSSLQQRLVESAGSQQSAFHSLNSAFFEDGAVIEIPDGVQVQQPIHLIFISAANQPIACHPRNLIFLGKNSKATIVETYFGYGDLGYFTNCFTEIGLAVSAELHHQKLQHEQPTALHLAKTHVQLQAHSRYNSHYFSFGGELSRNEIECFLDGEEIECTLNGLYMPSGDQLMDCRTKIDHARPNCRSNELYKGILDDRAKGVFNGKIYVHPHAQKTNAMQSNQAILLSDDAVIDTKPQLEIYADDVRCTHGATVGELDAQAMHYLRTRGIPLELARAMLIFAFANDVVQGVNIPTIQRRLEALLLADRGLPEI